MTARINEKILNFINDIHNINYIILTSNTFIRDKLIKIKARLIFYQPYEVLETYLDVAAKLVNL